MPASISFNADHAGADPINRGNCKEGTCTNWTRVQGWSSVVGIAPTAIPIGCGEGIDAQGRPNPCPPPEQLGGRWCENCTCSVQHYCISLRIYLNRNWSPRFFTLWDKNGWIRTKTAENLNVGVS
jgi:hypothetical protein